ncbi:MAG: universal stress protein [Planctomycetota bacterium]|jgi:nucleotide-binding universal stress UspA family protein
MLKYNNILVGVQFRESRLPHEGALTTDSREAVDRATLLAKSEGARLTFVTAFESHPASIAERKAAETDEDTILPSIRREMDRLVAATVALNLDAGWEFLFGTPWKELCAKVDADDHDLLVVGTRKRSGFARAVMGSTSQRVSHFASCPVWVVQHQPRQRYETIVIATDLTDIGELVLRHGLSWACWNKSEVHIVHAVPNWYEGRWYRAGHAKEVITREHEEQKAKARDSLSDQLASMMPRMALPSTPHVHVQTGPVESVIWRAVIGHGASLLVMGIVGRSGMQRYLVGDTAEKLLPELPCSLLTVKRAGFRYSDG